MPELDRRAVLIGAIAASIPVPNLPPRRLSLAEAVAADMAAKFILDPPGYVRPPLLPFVPTKFVPDGRYSADEVNAVLAFEAHLDGLACPRRDDCASSMIAAITKGYDPLRARPFKTHL